MFYCEHFRTILETLGHKGQELKLGYLDLYLLHFVFIILGTCFETMRIPGVSMELYNTTLP